MTHVDTLSSVQAAGVRKITEWLDTPKYNIFNGAQKPTAVTRAAKTITVGKGRI